MFPLTLNISNIYGNIMQNKEINLVKLFLAVLWKLHYFVWVVLVAQILAIQHDCCESVALGCMSEKSKT